jgi:hypothetical protein
MKTANLFRSSLLTAGLLLGGVSVAHADSAYTIILRGGDFHSPPHEYHSCRHTGRHSGYRHDNGYHSGHHKKHSGKHHHGHHDRWSRYPDKGDWLQGKFDDRHEAGRHGQHSLTGAIGYTGRS